MAIVYTLPIKAARALTDYIDTVESAWVRLESWQVGICHDLQKTFSALSVPARASYHFVECETSEVATKTVALMKKKGAKLGEMESDAKVVYVLFLVRPLDPTHTVNIHTRGSREIGEHLRLEEDVDFRPDTDSPAPIVSNKSRRD